MNDNSHYDIVLNELRIKKEKLASRYISKLYIILRNEEHRSPGECRAKIEKDCSDIWSVDTIRKYLPPETKSATKRKAGKISGQAKIEKKAKEVKEAKALVINSEINRGSRGQISALIDNRPSEQSNNKSDSNSEANSVGMILTENASVGQKKQDLGAFQTTQIIQPSAVTWTDDENYNSFLIADRLKDEIQEILEDVSLEECINECSSKTLILPWQLAERIYLDVRERLASDAIPDFELKHNGTKIISVNVKHD